MSGLIISQELLDKLVSHCKTLYPDEACGILAGKNSCIEKIYEMTNIERSSVSYLMDSKEQFNVMKQLRKEGHDMVAIYHSHPHSPAYPSAKDVNLAFYPDAACVIVSLIDIDRPVIKAFEIANGIVSDVEIEIRNKKKT